ncbi:Crp/Fnr family transcriptional regulator [Pseudoflavonifractor capillosus]|uniref:Crp/Fnr family transcriptional regulator n=1 Tax=Pseudoflavonifractor capillosus TaxID=106588 RepID=UPI00195B6087|nr:Crp/Fnr family transcriptional regulator [Pseudoflavonifractor capillosus]MBM6896374.1 Crp/Fnr family transcriptional regulator [Pseudoflavonifractor capillosus]
MRFSEIFPVWEQLTPAQQALLEGSAIYTHAEKGTVLHNGSADCLGLLLVCSGQLRGYILSDEGREITLYRLFERDMCLFSASCMLQSIQFDIQIQVEKDADFWVIPPDVYKSLMEQSPAVANFTNEVMSTRFSEVMWLMEQVMWKSFDKRLADFLLQESVLEGTSHLELTHEKIANHMGTAREVVTRMLRYFQQEGLVSLSRGVVDLVDENALRELSNE